jgi:hypothetical protein
MPNAINGESEITAENPDQTKVVNKKFENIEGPATGSPANPHQNMDNDRRVQEWVIDEVIREVEIDISEGN